MATTPPPERTKDWSADSCEGLRNSPEHWRRMMAAKWERDWAVKRVGSSEWTEVKE
jgi:hypothetical protein